MNAIKKIQCEVCGSPDVIKMDTDFFQCQHCGCKYTLAQMRLMISGTVEVVKGHAEMDRLLGNADAQIRFGEYEKAEKVFMQLADEYPGEHIVWEKYMTCLRAKLLSGAAMLNAQEHNKVRTVAQRMLLTMGGQDAKQALLADDRDFWLQLAATKLNKIDRIDLFRYVYDMVVHKGKKPQECIDTQLWDILAASILSSVQKGELLLVSTGAAGSLPALMEGYIQEHFAIIRNMVKLHRGFETMLHQGKENAKKMNARPMRMAWYCQHGTTTMHWLRGGRPELEGLYVNMEFCYGRHVFGSYKNYGYGTTHANITEVKCIDLAERYEWLCKNISPEKDMSLWNNEMYNCPFCGTQQIADGLLGRKCKVCHRALPRLK